MRQERSASSDDLARSLAVIAALRIAFVTVSLGAVFALGDAVEQPNITQKSTLIAVAYLVSLLFALALRWNASTITLAYAQVVVDALLVTSLVLTTGGIDSVFTFTYVFVVIGAATTLARRGAALAAAACLLLIGTMAVLQVDGSIHDIPKPDPGRAALSVFTYIISLSLVAALAGTLAENVRAAGKRLAERESDLLRLEELHAAILRSLPAGLMTLDPAGGVRYANEAAFSILELDADGLVGRRVDDAVPAVGRAFRSLNDSGRSPNPRERYEGTFMRTQGGPIRLGFSFAPLGDDSAALGSIVVFQDVTEIVRLKEAFERADRLATIGKLAAGLAHEVRNPLSSMCASIDVLKVNLEPPEPMRRLMDNVVREGERLNGLITDFLTFARPREVNLRPTDLSVLAEDAAQMFGHDPELSKASIELKLTPGVLSSVDADLVRQVLWNLVRNAVQALEGKGNTVTLTTRMRDGLPEIVVSDNGAGMAPEVLRRIFDPFFTTKDRGTGLGLPIAHSIIEAHGGTILVSSALGVGTEFVLRLPPSAEGSPNVVVGHPENLPAALDSGLVSLDADTSDLAVPQPLEPPISMDMPTPET